MKQKNKRLQTECHVHFYCRYSPRIFIIYVQCHAKEISNKINTHGHFIQKTANIMDKATCSI